MCLLKSNPFLKLTVSTSHVSRGMLTMDIVCCEDDFWYVPEKLRVDVMSEVFKLVPFRKE